MWGDVPFGLPSTVCFPSGASGGWWPVLPMTVPRFRTEEKAMSQVEHASESVSDVAGPGIVTGDAVGEIFRVAKEQGFALPAVNCVGTNSVNACMEVAREVNSPIIIQFSNSGGAFFSGKTLSNEGMKNSVLGCIAAAR